MSTPLSALAMIQASEDRSLVRTMLDALPTDPAALFVLGLVVVGTVAVIVYGRKSGQSEGGKK